MQLVIKELLLLIKSLLLTFVTFGCIAPVVEVAIAVVVSIAVAVDVVVYVAVAVDVVVIVIVVVVVAVAVTVVVAVAVLIILPKIIGNETVAFASMRFPFEVSSKIFPSKMNPSLNIPSKTFFDEFWSNKIPSPSLTPFL
jgi:hypothetical protein